MGYKTLGQLVQVNYGDKDLYIHFLQERLGLYIDSYFSTPINWIQFSYIIRDGLAENDDNRILFKNTVEDENKFHIFNNNKLPVSMNPEDYGRILDTLTLDNGVTRYYVDSESRIYMIDVDKDKNINIVKILGGSKFTWTDYKLIDSDGFRREIGKSTIYFLDGEAVINKQERPAKAFKQLNKEKTLKEKFITFDIETINKDNEFIPYLINGYDGKNHFHTFIDSNMDTNNLFKTWIKNLLEHSHVGINYIYAHNLSGFDGLFILQHLVKHEEKLHIKPLIHNGRIISIEFKSKDGKILIFKDSFLLLPLSLRRLCKAFNVENVKGKFPILFNDINYIGTLPDIQHWNQISQKDYIDLLKQFENKWSFKEESLKYCKLDCVSLHEVLLEFNRLIFKKFSININKSLTLPSLAMKIFKSQYLNKNEIYQILGNVEHDIRQSYTGGAVDMYIPSNNNEFKLFYYDVNSLYPFIMANYPMPIGKPTYFEGDITKIEKDAFGFFYCKITSPSNLNHPILQRRVKTINGLKDLILLITIKPLKT